MNKYQKALDEIMKEYLPSASYSFPINYYLKEQLEILQELINEYYKLLDKYKELNKDD